MKTLKELKHIWIRMVHKMARRLGLYGTLDSEKALRAKNAEILRLQQELEQNQGFPKVTIREPLPKTTYTVCSYEPPDPTTYGKLAAQGIRQRAMTRQLTQNTGQIMRHHDEMLKKKHITRKLDVDTASLPSVPRSSLQPRRYSFMRLDPSEPGPYDTHYMPVTWLL